MNSDSNINQTVGLDRHTELELIHTQETIQDFFANCVKKFPNYIAVSDHKNTLTYAELNQKSNQLAHYIRQFDVNAETLIAISMERSVEFVVSVLAVIKAGCAYVPLDYTHPVERLGAILEENEAPLLITTSDQSHFSQFKGERICLDKDAAMINQCKTTDLNINSTSNQLAYVIYTSGSTGKPKGVLIEHQSLVNYAKWFQQYAQCKPGQRIDFSSNYIFDMAITSYLVALMSGLQIVICSDDVKKDVRNYLQFLTQHQINLTKLTPSFFKILLQQATLTNADLSHLHTIILGGEKLQTIDCANWLRLYPHHVLFNEYGPTEAAVAVLELKITAENLHQFADVIPIGKPNSQLGIHCYVLNKDQTLSAPDVIGELHIGGINLARGYLKQPTLTNEKFIHHPIYSRLYKTGDFCRYLSNGNIEYIGRGDDQVKIRGFRIELSEVETTLSSHPAIKDAIVIAREMSADDYQLIAYFRIKPETTSPDAQTLRSFLQKTLPDYMIPTAFMQLDVYPLTDNGKLDKKALPEPQAFLRKKTREPQTDLQKQITTIWSDVLNIQQISIDDNFFELGGHSLSVARIISRLEQCTGKIISLKDFYARPTIEGLSEFLMQTAETSTAIDKKTLSETSAQPIVALSDFQFLFWISHIFEPKVKKLNIVSRRRLAGQLSIPALNFAFEHLFKKHQILSHQISKVFPAQHYRHHLRFQIIEKDIKALSSSEKEVVLTKSMHQLIDVQRWKKTSPLLIAKLFYLEDSVSELQVCMPHIVSDDASEEILFRELSKFYNAFFNQETIEHAAHEAQYQHYVAHEHDNLHLLNRDIQFWESYLDDASLFEFPASVIDDNCKVYSTYLDVPERNLQNIQRISQYHQISFVDLLCASIVISLKKSFMLPNQTNKKILLNIIKSTREREMFEKMLGCFIRLDPVKVDMLQELSLIALAKHIRASMLDISKYQQCSSMVKLACMTKKHWENKKIYNFVMKHLSHWYATLFPKLKLHPRILSMYARLKALRTPRHFLININLFHNFIDDSHQKNASLFNLKTMNLNIFRYDLSRIDNVLDICFLRDDARDKTYLVVSGNLKSCFRERLGQHIIEAMTSQRIS